MDHLTDEELAACIAEGNTEAYKTLIERHQDYVITLIYGMIGQREAAEDLAQEVFIRVYRSMDRFRGDAKFTTWLYRLAVNAVTDYRRTQRRRPVTAWLDKMKDWLGTHTDEPEAQFLLDEQKTAVHAALLQLPDNYRVVLYLYHFKQLSYQEISDVLQLPLKTVETRLYRGKTMLKQKWLEVNGHAGLEQAPKRGAAAVLRRMGIGYGKDTHS